MPKITDATAIKQRIGAAACAVIANEGIQSASMRRVAQEAGSTTGLLTHYFRDKDELVTYAYRLVLDRMLADAAQRVAGAGTIGERLQAAIEAIEPTGPELKRFTVVMINFWAQAAFNPAFATRCKQDYRRWRALIAGTIRSGIAAGELQRGTDVRALTDLLTLLSDGLSVGMTLTPANYPRGHRRAIISGVLQPYLRARRQRRGALSGSAGA
jgi:AcrR family transcriptional regulator